MGSPSLRDRARGSQALLSPYRPYVFPSGAFIFGSKTLHRALGARGGEGKGEEDQPDGDRDDDDRDAHV